jgi:hypothetical protein
MYIDIDDFKKYKFEIYIYYVKDNLDTNFFQVTNIQIIMYLSKLLNNVEKKY